LPLAVTGHYLLGKDQGGTGYFFAHLLNSIYLPTDILIEGPTGFFEGNMKSRMENSGNGGLSGPADPTGERILFVDDEELVAHMGSRLLELHGYQVTYRTNSTEALELFRIQPEKYDLLITDHSMPYMTGAELSREVLKIRPDLPIILCTASSSITEKEVKQFGVRRFLPKPFDSGKLITSIRTLLDEQ
jgi:CheY-like chemotaxis protein